MDDNSPYETYEGSCMKIPLTSMRVDRFASSLNPLGGTLLQPVLKSFLTVFDNDGLENKLTRAAPFRVG